MQLHLNCVGFTAIDQCISNYPDVESLWLERNKVEKIEHLDALKRLRQGHHFLSPTTFSA